jgi:hypothetical protein
MRERLVQWFLKNFDGPGLVITVLLLIATLIGSIVSIAFIISEIIRRHQ